MTRFLLTMQYNESLLLPVFLDHYRKYFGADRIFVIDHGSPVAIPEAAKGLCTPLRIPRDRPFSEVSRMKLVKYFAAGLLEYFDYGIYVDCDELIHLDAFDESTLAETPVAYVAGFDVFAPESSGDRRILGLFNPNQSKPLIFRVVPDWNLGFHGCDHAPTRLDVPLAHVRYLYRERSISRMDERREIHRNMDPTEKRHGVAGHWADAEAEYEAFRALAARHQASGAQPLPFRPLNPQVFFESQPMKTAAAGGRAWYRPKGGGYSAIDGVFDLTEFFGGLLDARPGP